MLFPVARSSTYQDRPVVDTGTVGVAVGGIVGVTAVVGLGLGRITTGVGVAVGAGKRVEVAVGEDVGGKAGVAL